MRKIILFVLFYLFLVTLGYSEGLFFKSVEIGSEFNSSINSFYQDGFEYLHSMTKCDKNLFRCFES